MTLRTEFTTLAQGHGVTVAELARRFGISRKTAYKWLARVRADEPLIDRSRRPRSSPTRTDTVIEQALVELRQAHPCWGGRKLRQVLLDRNHTDVPAPSTITHILRRHGLMPERATGHGGTWKRFEHASPNDLWQMDFKGTIAVGAGRCDPLTVLDDHSRYNLVLRATPDMRSATVQAVLTDTFRRHGLPVRMNMDNGSPWGSPSRPIARTLRAEPLVGTRRHPRQLQHTSSSANQRQGRTLSPQPQRGGHYRAGVQRPRSRAARL